MAAEKASRRVPLFRSTLVLALLSQTVAAQELQNGRDDWLVGMLSVGQETIDNINGERLEELKESESTVRISGSLESQWHTDFSTLNLEYNAERTDYDTETQIDDTSLNGNSRLLIGTEYSVVALEAEHSQRRVLNSAQSSTFVLSESQDRQIASITPLARLRFGSANTLLASYTKTQVRYEQNDTNDSDRDTALLQLTHSVSPLMELGFALQRSDVSLSAFDYTTNAAYLVVLGHHRLYDYEIRLGATDYDNNSIEPSTTNSYSALLTSDLADSTLEFSAQRIISDTSIGNANSSMFSGGVSFDSEGGLNDIIVWRSAGVTWSNQWMCARCSATVNLTRENLEYQSFPAENNRQTNLNISFGYEFSRHLSMALSPTAAETEYYNSTEVRDDKRYGIRADLGYRFKSLEVSATFERELQDRAALDALVSVNSVGVFAAWLFE